MRRRVAVTSIGRGAALAPLTRAAALWLREADLRATEVMRRVGALAPFGAADSYSDRPYLTCAGDWRHREPVGNIGGVPPSGITVRRNENVSIGAVLSRNLFSFLCICESAGHVTDRCIQEGHLLLILT